MLSQNDRNPHNESKDQQLVSIKKEIKAPVFFPLSWISVGSAPISIMTQHLPLDDASRLLARTCRFFYHNYKPVLDQRQQETLAHPVVVKPNEDNMLAMLNRDPRLINTVINKIEVGKGDSKKILLKNTIYQLAYGAGDYEMCLAMKPFFVKVYGSEQAAIQEMDRQLNEKFAENKKEDERKDKQAKADLEALLKPVIEAITNEQFNLGEDANKKLILSDATMIAINTFRKGFADSQPKTIEKGPHFRDNTLLETYAAYASQQWDDDYNKCALFEDGILSYVLLYAPENVIQRFSQGLYYQQDRAEKPARADTLRDGINNFYLLSIGPSFNLSLAGSCIDIIYGCIETRISGPRGGLEGGARRLSQFISNKTSNLQSLRGQSQLKSFCIIC